MDTASLQPQACCAPRSLFWTPENHKCACPHSVLSWAPHSCRCVLPLVFLPPSPASHRHGLPQERSHSLMKASEHSPHRECLSASGPCGQREACFSGPCRTVTIRKTILGRLPQLGHRTESRLKYTTCLPEKKKSPPICPVAAT